MPHFRRTGGGRVARSDSFFITRFNGQTVSIELRIYLICSSLLNFIKLIIFLLLNYKQDIVVLILFLQKLNKLNLSKP